MGKIKLSPRYSALLAFAFQVCYAVLVGVWLQTFGDRLSIGPIFKGQTIILEFFTLEDGIDRLFRNVVK